MEFVGLKQRRLATGRALDLSWSNETKRKPSDLGSLFIDMCSRGIQRAGALIADKQQWWKR
jgi:hypothetical protein